MPSFKYVGFRGETIVGMKPEDLSAEQYDALDYDHQNAVLLNRGSDGGPLYVEVPDAPPLTDEAAQHGEEPSQSTVVEAPAEPTPEPSMAPATAADASGRIPPTTDAPIFAPEPTAPLGQPAPSEGAN